MQDLYSFTFTNAMACMYKARQGIHYNINKGAKLVGAVGARAPTLFLPRPEFAPIWG